MYDCVKELRVREGKIGRARREERRTFELVFERDEAECSFTFVDYNSREAYERGFLAFPYYTWISSALAVKSRQDEGAHQ